MNRTNSSLFLGACLFATSLTLAASAQAQASWNFTCDTNQHKQGLLPLSENTRFTPETSAGFDLGTTAQEENKSCHADQPFFLSVKAPEGTYLVTVKLGSDNHDSVTTVKAESRRIMLNAIKTSAHQSKTETFIVHVRTKAISTGEEVHLKPREIGALDWDDKLTLEFSGSKPSFQTISIRKIDHIPTVYLAGDSTVVDQDKEPWAAWGQVLPRFFDSHVVISNQAESGETIRSFVTEKRFDKIASTIQAGDYLFIQFAHNDQKPGKGLVTIPDYRDFLKKYIKLARDNKATPVLVTSMNRRNFDSNGKIVQTLGDYPAAMREAAKEENVALIDLNAMSKTLFEALGPQGTLKAFVHYPANTFPDQPEELKDDTHFTDYGADELAQCVVKGIKDAHLPLAKSFRHGVGEINPAKPDDPSTWTMPLDPQVSTDTPYGR
jgi:lysophospholipase L1-like esterase